MLQLTGLALYYENPIGRLYEHPDGYVVIDYNAGDRVMSEYRAFLTHLENLLKLRGWNKMLANQRLLTPFTDEERTWIREQWLQVSHAVQREMLAAVLLPNDVFARLGMTSLMQDAREGALRYRVFNDAQAAAAWLRAEA
ncbi:hypothetical protein [Hymenobacter guriensis]|uniref:STAS/SEC14 domain-containing protein n=1 Tax=Hymenobacter guriensis TaxID=2793065 RepID=A0ABS0L8U0_9BACT|nr:hypothetical protein [Hymenobacter guriensis]MBG8555988.1 hypothetical protein [Hymenobacter guriensis]